MRNLLLLVLVAMLIEGCSPSKSTIETAIALTEASRPTETSLPTDTPEQTAIPYTFTDEEKRSLLRLMLFAGPGVECDDVNYVDRELKLSCTFDGIISDPEKNFPPNHFYVIKQLINHAHNENLDGLFANGESIKIVMRSAMDKRESLSITPMQTMMKVIDGKITTVLEWLSEAQFSAR